MAASTSSSSLDENAIILISSDGETFEIEEDVAVQIKTIHMSFEDLPLGKKFPLPIVKGNILAKVIEYCKKHVQNNPDNSWDKQFMKEMDLHTLICLLNAADYLNIRPLLNLTCQTVADKIKGNTPEEIREIFNIKNDFTPQEEAQVRKENAWAFDD